MCVLHERKDINEIVLKIYLDNCCFNRPYDDQSQVRISLETQAKLYIQNLIKEDKLKLVSSYMLWYENGQNPYEIRKSAINEFIETNTSEYVGSDRAEEIREKSLSIIETGVKPKDAQHIASAIAAGCDYFLSTDDRLLKYETNEITLMNPVDFIKDVEDEENDE